MNDRMMVAGTSRCARYMCAIGVCVAVTATTTAIARQIPAVTFADAGAAAGIGFVHQLGGTGERYMVETMGSGVALADLDGDGWLDAYFVQSAPTPGFTASGAMVNQHFRNRGDGSFDDVTGRSDAADGAYGQGVAAADYDNDGFVDLYVTNFGANRLYRNNGDGTFTDATEGAGVGDDLWGTSTAWSDIDHDGLLDLYVANYVDFSWDNHKFCGDSARDLQAYCHPDVYNAAPDRLYRNRGRGLRRDRCRGRRCRHRRRKGARRGLRRLR